MLCRGDSSKTNVTDFEFVPQTFEKITERPTESTSPLVTSVTGATGNVGANPVNFPKDPVETFERITQRPIESATPLVTNVTGATGNVGANPNLNEVTSTLVPSVNFPKDPIEGLPNEENNKSDSQLSAETFENDQPSRPSRFPNSRPTPAEPILSTGTTLPDPSQNAGGQSNRQYPKQDKSQDSRFPSLHDLAETPTGAAPILSTGTTLPDSSQNAGGQNNRQPSKQDKSQDSRRPNLAEILGLKRPDQASGNIAVY